jgi:hypothetical protein
VTERRNEKLRSAVLAAFADQHRAMHEVAPDALHAVVEGDAILLVARSRAASTGPRGRSVAASLAQLQHAVVQDVYLRTGELLHPGGRSASRERGLLVLAFERLAACELLAEATAGRTAGHTR